jgi:hypothetical protein
MEWSVAIGVGMELRGVEVHTEIENKRKQGDEFLIKT